MQAKSYKLRFVSSIQNADVFPFSIVAADVASWLSAATKRTVEVVRLTHGFVVKVADLGYGAGLRAAGYQPQNEN